MTGNYTYVINRPDGAHKVGYSQDPKSRLAALRPLVGRHAVVTFSLHRPNGDGYVVEGRAHELLQDHALGYEWFQVSAEEAKEAVIYAALLVDKVRFLRAPADRPSLDEVLFPPSRPLHIGYVRPIARLSHDEQRARLRSAGVAGDQIYIDAPGQRFAWSAALKDIRQGDTFVVASRRVLGTTKARVATAVTDVARRQSELLLLDA